MSRYRVEYVLASNDRMAEEGYEVGLYVVLVDDTSHMAEDALTCLSQGTHLSRCDADGYCLACGYQDQREERVLIAFPTYAGAEAWVEERETFDAEHPPSK